jgi:hypothetical protein
MGLNSCEGERGARAALDPFVCLKCGAEKKVITVIDDPNELKRIHRYLVKIGRSPPIFELALSDNSSYEL